MEMTGIARGCLGALIITVLVLLATSPTSGEEHQLVQANEGPPSLQQRVVRGAEEEVKKAVKKKKKKSNQTGRKKPNKRNFSNSKKPLRGKKGKNNKKRNKKRNKNGRKKKRDRQRRKKKRRNRGGKRQRKSKKKTKLRQSSSCQNISCLNNLLQVLKIDKDTVQNFMQQKKRLDKKLNLASNKKGKSNVTGETVAALRKSLGGEKALKNNRPVCHGRYNITDAIQGQVMYNNISQCDTLVKTACNFSLPANETAEVEACNKVMGAFR